MWLSLRLGVIVEPGTSEDNRSGGRGGSPGWHRELVDLGALFLAVALADLLANTLAHRPLGPVVLISLGVSLLLSAVLHRRCTHRPARRPAPPPAPDPSGSSRGVAGGRNLWRVRTAVRDNPGSLAALAASLAGHGLNILSVQVHAVADGAVDEFLVEAPSGTACTDVITATETGGGRDVYADRADMHELVDVPTRVLTLAAQATGTGAQLAAALRALLGASTVCREDRIGEDQDEPDGVDGTTMRLGEPAGGMLTFERATLAFTPAEFARARALRDLAPLPPLVRLISNYWARLRQQAASVWPISTTTTTRKQPVTAAPCSGARQRHALAPVEVDNLHGTCASPSPSTPSPRPAMKPTTQPCPAGRRGHPFANNPRMLTAAIPRPSAVAVLGEREAHLSAVQRLALVDAAVWWLSEPNGGDEFAYALLAASCAAEITRNTFTSP